MRKILLGRSLAALLVGAALTLTACGSDDGEPQVLSETEHNAQDVTFATDMIQHHAQALVLVDLTIERTLEPEVEELAVAIRDAQAPEIELMTDWLVAWDEAIPPTMRDHVNAGHGAEDGDDHSMSDSMEGMDTDMPGMLSAEQLESLAQAPDEEFSELWLEAMIAHHEGAVEMAQTQADRGMFVPAVDLAEQVVETQTAEIARMQDLLG